MSTSNTIDPNFAKNLLTTGELAAAFGWSARFIEHLVVGEKLPALEVDGNYRFRRDEVVEWLQRKIQTLDTSRVSELESSIEDGLLREGVFRSHRNDRLASSLPLEGIALDLEIDSKSEVLRSLVETASKTGQLFDSKFLLASLFDREKLCSTAFPGGVAICHPRRPIPSAIARPFLSVVRTSRPVDFGASNHEGTSLFFLLCALDDRSHLHGLARLSRILHHGGIEPLLAAGDAREFKTKLTHLETQLRY